MLVALLFLAPAALAAAKQALASLYAERLSALDAVLEDRGGAAAPLARPAPPSRGRSSSDQMRPLWRSVLESVEAVSASLERVRAQGARAQGARADLLAAARDAIGAADAARSTSTVCSSSRRK